MNHGSPTTTPPGRAQEPELLARARGGDHEAFAALYNEHKGLVMSFIRPRVPSRELAEDLTQETFLKAYRRIDTFTWQGRDVGAWLMTIARNLVADHFKSAAARREWTVSEVYDTALEPSAEDEALIRIESADAVRRVTVALASLSPRQRAVITHRYLQERSISDTAALVGITAGAVKTMAWRGQQAMRRLVEADTTAVAA
ncbi:RNA polymerase sigma factor [Streptomyces sp. NPDC090026]|uniref:RNA polymerase sigma factor n=1 Tax=Streptomyces sp. NPDC090026 TaxID=3365923 RepID=UPI003823E455